MVVEKRERGGGREGVVVEKTERESNIWGEGGGGERESAQKMGWGERERKREREREHTKKAKQKGHSLRKADCIRDAPCRIHIRAVSFFEVGSPHDNYDTWPFQPMSVDGTLKQLAFPKRVFVQLTEEMEIKKLKSNTQMFPSF